MKTPEQWWMDYEKLLPPGCGHIQILETKRAFATGMSVVFEVLREIGESDDDEQADVNKLERFNVELQAMRIKINEAQ